MMRVDKIAAPMRAGAGVRMTSDLRMAQMLAAHVYGVPVEALAAMGRADCEAIEARQVAMYLGHIVLGMPLSALARGFDRDRTTVRHACRHVEELREDPAHDRLLSWMEALLRQAVSLKSARQGQGA